MSNSLVRDTVNATVAAGWTGAYVAENIPDSPPSDLQPFLAVEYMDGSESQGLMNGSQTQFLETGDVLLKMFVASGEGIEQGLHDLKYLGGLFRHLDVDGVRFGDPQPVETYKDSSVGNWYELEMSIDYRHDYAVAAKP